MRLQSFTDCIQNTFNIVPIHDVKIWNIHIRHQLQNKQESIPNISNLIDIHQLLIYLCFISFTKQSKKLLDLSVDQNDISNEVTFELNDDNVSTINTFMDKIGHNRGHNVVCLYPFNAYISNTFISITNRLWMIN